MSRPTRTGAMHNALRIHGAAAYLAGKPIGAFYDLPAGVMPSGRHNELARGSYEIGWRGAKAEAHAAQAAAARALFAPLNEVKS